MYRKFGKRLVDVILSGIALIPLSVVYLILAIAIKIDDPGPVFFRQKRVGLHKTHFEIMKFRTMKMETPKDMPTHLLKNPEQYITRVGGFLRKYSLDELPQILQIFTGKMSIVGPRPALWNQFDLIEERDKYGANDVRPGLTGWAQINGRDELPIDVKARLDGEYVEKMGFLFDMKCMIGTVLPVFTGAGVVEGGTGTLKKENEDA
jgi:O-antigen biosynthesis protein WbqP